MNYTDKVMEHFMSPHNVGKIEDADGVGKVGNPVCGDMMAFYIKVENDHIADVKFQTFGCGAAIAVSSMVSDMAMGKSLDEAMAITNEDVAEELGGLPKNKHHCSNLGADALHEAIKDYRDKLAGKTEEKTAAAAPPASGKVSCPYCETPVPEMKKLCKACNLEFVDCPECGDPMKKDAEECPHCGKTTVRV